MGFEIHVLLIFFTAGGVGAYVDSCEEVQNRYNGTTFSQRLNFACVVTQEGFTNWDQLNKIYLSADMSWSLSDIARSVWGCVQKPTDLQWMMTFDDRELKCYQEFSFITTSEMPTLMKQSSGFAVNGGQKRALVVPQTGMWIRQANCTVDPNGEVTISTGVGIDRSEWFYDYGSRRCDSFPDWIFSFDNAISITADASVSITLECSSDIGGNTVNTVSVGDRVALITAGGSDNLQNLQGTDHRARIQIGESEFGEVSGNILLKLDSKNTGSVVLQKSRDGPLFDYNRNGMYLEQFNTNYFEVRWVPKGLPASQIESTFDDQMFVEFDILKPVSTMKPVISTIQMASYHEIWLDIVVILDTSEAMGATALAEAEPLIESLFGNKYDDFLSTNMSAPFYSRVGILYNLNVTKNNAVRGKTVIMNGLAKINVVDISAMEMLNGGLTAERANTRQVIYYMIGTNPAENLDSLNQFKASHGVIIVNDFRRGIAENITGMFKLASVGYYYSARSYPLVLHSFCEGGCYMESAWRDPFSRAKATCGTDGGIIATVHDEDKGQLIRQMLPSPTWDYFWIGYEKQDDGIWQWEDQSMDPFTNWAANEPSDSSVAKCAYVDGTTNTMAWGAGNCNVAFPYVCQYAPFSVGNKYC